MLRAKIFVVAIVVIFCSRLARADESDFAAGTTVLSLSGSWMQPIRYSEADLTSVSATWGKFFWNNHSLSL